MQAKICFFVFLCISFCFFPISHGSYGPPADAGTNSYSENLERLSVYFPREPQPIDLIDGIAAIVGKILWMPVSLFWRDLDLDEKGLLYRLLYEAITQDKPETVRALVRPQGWVKWWYNSFPVDAKSPLLYAARLNNRCLQPIVVVAAYQGGLEYVIGKAPEYVERVLTYYPRELLTKDPEPLLEAVLCYDNEKIIELLVQHGAVVKQIGTGYLKPTALHVAARLNHFACINKLLQLGAWLTDLDGESHTVLAVATSKSREFLVERAEVIQKFALLTALHARCGARSPVRFLCQTLIKEIAEKASALS